MRISRTLPQVILSHLIVVSFIIHISSELEPSTTYSPPIPRTTKSFSYARLTQHYFVDKSLFIKEFWLTTHATVVITRARRWGKSLNMDMLATFLRIETDAEGKIVPPENRLNPPLFVGGNYSINPDQWRYLQPLKISEDKVFVKTIMGNWPVIQLSMNVRGRTYSELIQTFQTKILQLFRDHEREIHAYVNFENGKFYTARTAMVEHYMTRHTDISEYHLTVSLCTLSKILHKHFGKPVIILLDEFDTPLAHAFKILGGYTEEYRKFEYLYDEFILHSLKGNSFCAKALLTGVYDIEIPSLIPDASLYSVFNTRFSEYYGFTESEAKLYHENIPNDLDFNDIKLWYNGYTYGDHLMYNPYTITRCLEENKIDNYWLSTGYDKLSDGFVLEEDQYFEILRIFPNTTTEIFQHKLKVRIDFHDARNTETIYTLLVFLGYLNAKPNLNWPSNPSAELTIPNTEVRCIMKSELINWLYGKLDRKIDYSAHEPDFYDILALKMNKFESDLVNFTKLSTSYFSRKTAEHGSELYYHWYLIALISFHPKTHYIEDKPTVEEGRTNIGLICIPKAAVHRTGVIWELKKATKSELLSESAAEALKQIYDKRYDVKLKSMDHVETIINIGISFHSKQIGFTYTIEKRNEINREFVVWQSKEG